MGHRVVLYCRVSTADQSCERPERDLLTLAMRAGYEVVGIYKETGSGARLDRAERKKVMAPAQARQIDAVLVTALSRWGRSTMDLLHMLRELEARRVSLIAMSGMALDLGTATGRMLATVLAGIAEFERDLLRERVRSGLVAARARGKVLALVAMGSYGLIGRELGLSKNTVAGIVKRDREAKARVVTGMPA
ncbi:recombinase family protein [Niveispirillum sp. KHB5.9]|uniref:recombinase family protein n=1 Tax=Niveispirillum sp. KHB5.9 TaxID=3400269 RepID=UPI003A8AC27C